MLHIICSWVRVSEVALLRGKERDVAVDTGWEEPPHHRLLPCPPGPHAPWEHNGGDGDAALLPTKHKSKGGKQERSGEPTLREAKLGVRRGKHSKALDQESRQGEAAHPADVGESTNILHGKATERGDGGCGRRKEGKFPVTGTGQGGLSAARAGEGLTGCHGRGDEQNYHLPKRSESMRT